MRGRATRHPLEVLRLETFAERLAEPPTAPGAAWRTELLRLRPGERARLESLCRAHHLEVIDAFGRQMDDLAMVRLPGESDEERKELVAEAVRAAGGADACGTWVHVPWEGRIVHLLDEDDYLEVVTNRNRDKITREEQLLLRTRRVWVVGLSVGGEAAVAVAQEHLCGEIVLADFDDLDLSNLNRLGAGFDDLGRNKGVLVARRIAKLDPYLRVRLFPEGLTEWNLDAVLDGLDLLIEECDGLSMKHEVRVRARALDLNIVFAGDERGFLSVEPYGQVPDLPPFHGLIDGPQLPREAYASTGAFWRALTVWLGGWEAISERSRASLEQIGSRLGGYPQLAGEARYAAGQIAHVARRLLLDETVPPFVGHLDLDHLVPSGPRRS